MTDNKFNDCWQRGDIHRYDNQCQCDISQCHDGDDDTTDFSNALHTTEDDNQCGYCNDASHNGMVKTESVFKSCT